MPQMPEIQYDLVDHSLLSLTISLQQIGYQAASVNIDGTRDFIFALDEYLKKVSAEIIRQGSR